MANNIPQQQNEKAALRLLIAQRRLYRWAKLALAVQVAFVVLVPGALVLAEQFTPRFKVWAAFIGLMISILDIALLDQLKVSLQHKAACAQEVFDCKVFDLDWPEIKSHKPDPEDIHGASDGQNADGLKNWYPADVSELPIHVARVICQRSNCWWDSKLRRFYQLSVLGLLALTTIVMITVALIQNLTFGDFILSLLAPVLPLILWGIREVKQQFEAANRVNQLKSFGDQLWKEIVQMRLPAEAAKIRSRMFQDEIFEHRRKSPMIFDWFYGLFRNRFEHQMQQGGREMINEAQDKGL